MTSTSDLRVLGIDPGTRHLGLAVLEGEEILWYHVKTLTSPRALRDLSTEVKTYLTKVIRAYQPSVIAIKEPFYSQAAGSAMLRALTDEVKTWARWQGLEVWSATPPEVKAFFCRDDTSRRSLAEAMIERYPFLRRYLTYLPWSMRYWFHVFDAVGFALMCHRKRARSRLAPRDTPVR
jgi:Holliday junction resolvasome RuvABC endonuclease subunit